jgi:hypothetical protein
MVAGSKKRRLQKQRERAELAFDLHRGVCQLLGVESRPEEAEAEAALLEAPLPYYAKVRSRPRRRPPLAASASCRWRPRGRRHPLLLCVPALPSRGSAAPPRALAGGPPSTLPRPSRARARPAPAQVSLRGVLGAALAAARAQDAGRPADAAALAAQAPRLAAVRYAFANGEFHWLEHLSTVLLRAVAAAAAAEGVGDGRGHAGHVWCEWTDKAFDAVEQASGGGLV